LRVTERCVSRETHRFFYRLAKRTKFGPKANPL
jgi:hypothetical protein